jgi:hypothetical protein
MTLLSALIGCRMQYIQAVSLILHFSGKSEALSLWGLLLWAKQDEDTLDAVSCKSSKGTFRKCITLRFFSIFRPKHFQLISVFKVLQQNETHLENQNPFFF